MPTLERLDDVEPVAWLSADLVEDAHERDHRRLDAGRAGHREGAR